MILWNTEPDQVLVEWFQKRRSEKLSMYTYGNLIHGGGDDKPIEFYQSKVWILLV